MAIAIIDVADKARNAGLASAVNAFCHADGVVTLLTGGHGNVFRCPSPSSIRHDLLNDVLDVMAEGFATHTG